MHGNMTRPSPSDLENASIALRLRILRHYIAGSEHGSQLIFATRVGVDYKRWHNFERGLPLNRDVAIHLTKAVPGLTLDWLYLGKEDGLPLKLQRDLAEAGKALTLTAPAAQATQSVTVGRAKGAPDRLAKSSTKTRK